jgi:ADP-ribosyl-[dinitrogen reductase] hydrolase
MKKKGKVTYHGLQPLSEAQSTKQWSIVFGKNLIDRSKSKHQAIEATTIERAQGCLLGQLAGDALGSLVEFQSPDEITRKYPNGATQLEDGGTWNTIAGQPTDDSEMALLLARMLVNRSTYDADTAFEAYTYWLSSGPFDCGATISAGIHGQPNHHSQANGAMMRVSPLGIFGSWHSLKQVAEWARADARLTHPNEVCQQANALFAMAIAHAIKTNAGPNELYEAITNWADEMKARPVLVAAIAAAASTPPEDYLTQMGWVIIAFQNTLWQLMHAPDLESGVIDTVMRGGDTDTNAAICGALLGAVYGRAAIPAQWEESVVNCRPERGRPGVFQPRPECFWPVDALELAEKLVSQEV